MKRNAKVFVNLDELQLLALCIYGEARGESVAGKIAVANVVMNRRKAGGWFGSTIREVVLKQKQFSCFNPSDKNYLGLVAIAANWEKALSKNVVLKECLRIADGVIDGEFPDNTLGATHYNTKKCDPDWDNDMELLITLGNHQFFVDKEKA